MAEESLRGKTIKGVGWSFVDSFASQGISFFIGLILARLLTPNEYGLIAIVLIFIAIFDCIVNSGFTTALIRKKDATEVDYNTVFITNLSVSVFLATALFLLAGLIADFFSQPQLKPLSQCLSIVIVINALSLVQRTMLTKKLDFKTTTKANLASAIVSGIIGVTMAFSGCGVWSLVGQQISRAAISTLLLWFYNRWWPKWKFSIESFRELFGFGWKLLVSSLIDVLWRDIYQIIIGKFYNATTLGQYSRAHQFSAIFSSNLTTIIQRVSFPVLSSIQDDKERMKEAYRKVIKVTMFVTFVLMLGLAAIAKPMIQVLIGDKWLIAATFLPIICFQMMLYPLHAINLNMLQVQGRSDLFLKLEIIKKCIAVIPLLLGIFIDIYWMLWGSVVSSLFSYYLNSYYSGRFLNYSISAQVKDILPSFGVATIMALIVYAVSLIALSPFILLPLQIVVGIILTILLCEIFKLKEYREVKNILSNVLKRRK